jgi:hypothetical protein
MTSPSSSTPPLSPRKRWLFRLVLVALIVIPAELVSCVALRVLGFERGLVSSTRHLHNPYRGHELNPSYLRASDTGPDHLHSPDGFRSSAAVPEQKPAGEYRIFLLGGSAAYGLGAGSPYPDHPSLKNSETVDHFLEERLNRDLSPETGQRYRVINAALIGYHTFQHAIYLNERLLRYQPDLLVFLDGHNDFYLCNPDYSPYRDYPYSSVFLVGSFDRGNGVLGVEALSHSLAAYSNTMSLVDVLTRKWWETRVVKLDEAAGKRCNGEDPAAYEATARNTYVRAYTQVASLAPLYGFKMAVFLQPELVFEDPANLAEPDQKVKALTEKLQGDDDVKRMRRIHALVPGMFRKYLPGLSYTDLSILAPVKTEEPLYVDYCHMTGRGSQGVAAGMAPVVKAIITGAGK